MQFGCAKTHYAWEMKENIEYREIFWDRYIKKQCARLALQKTDPLHFSTFSYNWKVSTVVMVWRIWPFSQLIMKRHFYIHGIHNWGRWYTCLPTYWLAQQTLIVCLVILSIRKIRRCEIPVYDTSIFRVKILSVIQIRITTKSPMTATLQSAAMFSPLYEHHAYKW